jgi:3-hydroxyacyl-[acyl-carrier-protein] dehydratase
VEALAQCSGVLYLKQFPENIGKPLLLVSLDKARFKKPIVPGDQVRLEVELVRIKGPFWKFRGKAVVDGEVAADVIFMAVVKP